MHPSAKMVTAESAEGAEEHPDEHLALAWLFHLARRYDRHHRRHPYIRATNQPVCRGDSQTDGGGFQRMMGTGGYRSWRRDFA